MAIPVLQHAFHSGEWAPELYARVDLQKYKAGAALLKNFYVDYRGGASTRQGTRFCNRALGTGIRLIPFQASSFTSYILEFGNGYIRFFSNGSPILETAFNVSAISGNSVTAAGNNFNPGDWVFIGSSYYIVLTGGSPFTVSDLWGNSSILPAITGTTAARVYTLASPFLVGDLFPNPNTGNPGIKYIQNVNSLIICHPNYQPQILNITAPNMWTISTIQLGSTVTAPTSITVTTTLGALGPPGWNYSYAVTAVDNNNQESAPTTGGITAFKSLNDATAPGTNNIAWSAVAGAASYNVYKADPTFNTAIAAGTPFGFIGNVTGTSMQDATPGIAPDFAQTPPIVQNPLQGAPVIGYTVTNAGAYSVVPTVAVTGGGGTGAAAQASLGVITATINSHGAGLADIFVFAGSPVPTNALMTFTNGVVIQATTVVSQGTGAGHDRYEVTAVAIFSAGSITTGSVPSNPQAPSNCSATGFQFFGGSFNLNLSWGVTQVNDTAQGAGYTSAPSVAFSTGAATATAILGSSGSGGLPNAPANPAVPAFLQERLVFGNLVGSPMSIEMSQPGSFYNFNISNPIQPDDAISVTIFSGELNDIRSMTPVPTGLLVLSGRLAWILNGGGGLSAYNPITPSSITANPQTFTGANDLPPLKIAQDILYCTNKGNYVRDLNYNIYANVFAGQDISLLATHLFFGYYLLQWTWAEEPFKSVWAVRNDGNLLSLTYVKDQEILGWAHHDTDGVFTSVASVLESNNGNTVDAVYVATLRGINGGTVQYVERIADRFFTYGMEDSWSVDCALRTQPFAATSAPVLSVVGDVRTVGNAVTITDVAPVMPFTPSMVGWVLRIGNGIFTITTYVSGNVVTATVTRPPNILVDEYFGAMALQGGELWKPVTTVGGLQHLLGRAVTGTADGKVVGPFTVSTSGTVTLPGTFTKVVLGLPFTPQLQTLPLDVATQPTVQGRPKVINAVSVRCAETLGLSIGAKFSTLVTMKDLVLGNLNYYLNATVTDLTNADARTLIDSTYTIPGQYCIQQNLPYPATVLGVIPEFEASR